MSKPIFMRGDKLEIQSEQMDIGITYRFNYLGVQMAAIKSAPGVIDIYQVMSKFQDEKPGEVKNV